MKEQKNKKTCVILQPSYIPWRGYFHQIQKADVFVFYDCVQYDDRGWRNRNKIKTAQGERWLSIPVKSKGCQTKKMTVAEVAMIQEPSWTKKHFQTLKNTYGKAPFFKKYLPLLQEIYERKDEKLADFTCFTSELIARELGIDHTKFIRSSTLPAVGVKTDRLVSILTQLNATHYVSGPSAVAYLEQGKLEKAGISLEWMSYDYPPYPQIHGPFIPNVTILDLLFNVGLEAPHYIWG